MPPVGVTVILPLFPPKQLTLVMLPGHTQPNAVGCTTVNDADLVHNPSVTVTVYAPADNPETSSVVAKFDVPLFHT